MIERKRQAGGTSRRTEFRLSVKYVKLTVTVGIKGTLEFYLSLLSIKLRTSDLSELFNRTI